MWSIIIPYVVFYKKKIQLPPMPKDYNPELTRVLSSMMQKDPTKRPTADDLINNDLFKRTKKPPVIAAKVTH